MGYTRGDENVEETSSIKKYEIEVTEEVVLAPKNTIEVELGEGDMLPTVTLKKGKDDNVSLKVKAIEGNGDEPESDLPAIFLKPSNYGKNAYYKSPMNGLTVPAGSIIRFWDRPITTQYGDALLLKCRKA